MRLILTLILVIVSTTASAYTRNQLVFPRGWNHSNGAVVIGEITEGEGQGMIRVRSTEAPYRESAFYSHDLADFESEANSSPSSRIKPGDTVMYKMFDRVLGAEKLRYGRVVISFNDGTVQIQDLNPQTLPDNLDPQSRGIFTRGGSSDRQFMLYIAASNVSARPNGCTFQFANP